MDIFENKIFKKEKEHLSFDGKDLSKLAEEYGTPLYIFSEREMRKNVKEVVTTFSKFYDNTKVHYAAQCEFTLANLQVIKECGCNLEVNSGGQLYKGLQAGFEGKQVIFNGACKTTDEIELAIKSGVKSINIDSIYELTKIVQIAEILKTPVNIALMIVPEITYDNCDYDERYGHEAEFGITFEQLRTAIRMSQRNKKYIRLQGYHFHIESKMYKPDIVHQAFLAMLETAVKMHQLTGFVPQSLNIGGGLSNSSMEQIAKLISQELHFNKIEQWAGKDYREFFKDIELIIEPGRKITASAGILLTEIVNEKYRKNLNENWLVLDAGLNTGLESDNIRAHYQLLCANKIMEYHVMPYKVSGLSYDTADYTRLPSSISAGDLIAIINAGAYSTVNMSNSNGKPRPAILMIKKSGTVKLVKRAQSYEDLLEGEESFNEKLNLCVI